jgi:hypothetical protein
MASEPGCDRIAEMCFVCPIETIDIHQRRRVRVVGLIGHIAPSQSPLTRVALD